jgi:hypothetical protein
MGQDNAAVFLLTLSFFIQQTAEWKSPSFRRSDHSCDFYKKAIPAEMTFEICGPRLRLREKSDPGPHTNQLRSEFEFGQRRFLDPGIEMI